MKNTKTPEERMDKVVANWYLEDFMMLGAWSMVEKIRDPNQKTIGINAKSYPPSISYNPNFINSLNDEMLEAIMASECFKLLLRHPTSRFKTPKEVSGLASQVTVDQLIMKNLVNTEGLKGVVPMPADFNLPNDSFFEDYFRRLMENLDQTQKNINKMFGHASSSGDGESEGGGGGDSEDEQDGEGSGNKEFKDQKEALKEYMNPRSTNTDGWGENDMLDAEVQNFVNENKSSSKRWGKFTGDFLTQIVAANTPKISFKEIVRRFNTSVQTSKQIITRMKPNRRFGLDVPGRKRINTTKILFAIDVSGSMSDSDLAEGFAVINSVCRHAVVHYMLFDTEIKSVETKFKRAQQTFKVSGRGGTDPAPVLKYVDEHKYDGVVIYSDMDFYSAQDKPKKAKVMWLGTNKGCKNPTSFGYFAVLDRNE